MAKVIFITGGSRGIGLAIGKKFAKEGNKVYFTYLRSKKSYFNKLAYFQSKNVIPIKCDMRDPKQIKSLTKKLNKEKKIDVLVNNVGDVIARSSFHKSSIDLWDKTINLNLMSAVRTTHALLPLLLKATPKKESRNVYNKKIPVVINISSIASRAGGSGDSLHYGVAKAALNIFTSGLAREFKRYDFGIRVVGIAPSIVDTDFQKRNSTKKRINKIIDLTPMRRMASAEEIANYAFFIASEKASYLSGDTIFVTGGR